MSKITDICDSWAMGKNLDCGHVIVDFDECLESTDGDPFQRGDEIDCPVCAEIKAAREGNLKDTLDTLEMARKEGREEVLEMAKPLIIRFRGEEWMTSDPMNVLWAQFEQAYKELFPHD